MQFGYVLGYLFGAVVIAAIVLAIVRGLVTVIVNSRRDVRDRIEAIQWRRTADHIRWWHDTYRAPIGPCQKQLAADMISYHAMTMGATLVEANHYS